jgi:hypothetical protein
MDKITSGALGDADIVEAFKRLEKYESLYKEIEKEQESIAEQMAKLKSEGKEKTLKYRELFTKKLQNVYVLSLFQSRGL